MKIFNMIWTLSNALTSPPPPSSPPPHYLLTFFWLILFKKSDRNVFKKVLISIIKITFLLLNKHAAKLFNFIIVDSITALCKIWNRDHATRFSTLGCCFFQKKKEERKPPSFGVIGTMLRLLVFDLPYYNFTFLFPWTWITWTTK